MTGDYPDYLKCSLTGLYIHSISADKKTAVYRSPSDFTISEIVFVEGNYSSNKFSFWLSDCINKPISTLIKEGKAFNLNSPVLNCPKDIISNKHNVDF